MEIVNEKTGMVVERDIWPPTNLYGTFEIGEGTTVGAFCDIGGKIGKNCKIQAGVKIPPLVSIGDNVFIGADTVFTNDKYPPSNNLEETFVGYGAMIGANCTILPGLTIGKNSKLGAGSVLTKDLPIGETWVGVPAKPVTHENK